MAPMGFGTMGAMRIVDEATLASHLSALPENPRVIANGSFPPRAALALCERTLPTFRLCLLNAQKPIPDREGITFETSFVGPAMRKSPRLRYYPSRLSMVPLMFRTTLPPDVVIVQCSAPHDGALSLGLEVNVLPDAIEAARARGALVVAQINPKMPFTFGDSVLSDADIDLAFEAEEELPHAAPAPIDDGARRIGELIASRVLDGSTLQAGIGAAPDAALSCLSTRQGLGVWTELMGDGVLALERAGALDPDRMIVTAFAIGSPELYEWVDNNPRVRFLRSTRTNDPGLIAQQVRMVSINTALQVDLFLQANASRVNNRIYSGTGGQTDFIVGAMHAPQGQAFLALKSWHPKADCSTIVAKITEPTTSMQMSAVVTENGIADVFGKSQDEQAREMIEHAAHPRVREELRASAREFGLDIDDEGGVPG